MTYPKYNIGTIILTNNGIVGKIIIIGSTPNWIYHLEASNRKFYEDEIVAYMDKNEAWQKIKDFDFRE